MRWRVLANGRVARSIDAGATWTGTAVDPALHITGGAAPQPQVCWLIGRAGVVLLSTDGTTFARVPFPDTADPLSIRASSAREATVTTAAGRILTTTDGGLTWRE